MTQTSTSDHNSKPTTIPVLLSAPQIQPISIDKTSTQMSDDSFEKVVKPLMESCVKEIKKAAEDVVRALNESEKAIGPESIFKVYRDNLERLVKLKKEITAEKVEAKSKPLKDEQSALIVQKENFEKNHFKIVAGYTHATVDDTLIITPQENSIFLQVDDKPDFYYSGSKNRNEGFGVEHLKQQQFVGKFHDNHRDSGVIFFNKEKKNYYVGDFQQQNLGYGCYSPDDTTFQFANFKTQKNTFPNITIQLGDKPLVVFNEAADKIVAFSESQKKYLIDKLTKLREGELAQVLKNVTDNTDRFLHFIKFDTDFGKGVGYGLGAAAVALGAYGAYKGIKYWMKSKKSKKESPEKPSVEARSASEAAAASSTGEAAAASSTGEAIAASSTGEAASSLTQSGVQQKKARGRPKGSVKKRRGRPPKKTTAKNVSSENKKPVRQRVSIKIEPNSEGTRKSARLSNK